MVAWLGLGDHTKEHMVETLKLLHCKVTVLQRFLTKLLVPDCKGNTLAQHTQENLPAVFQHLKFSRAHEQSL